MMIIIIIQSIYNEIKARSNKIPNVEKTAKSSVFQPFERNVDIFSLFNFNYEDFNINLGKYNDFHDSFIIDNNDDNYDDNDNNNDNNDNNNDNDSNYSSNTDDIIIKYQEPHYYFSAPWTEPDKSLN